MKSINSIMFLLVISISQAIAQQMEVLDAHSIKINKIKSCTEWHGNGQEKGLTAFYNKNGLMYKHSFNTVSITQNGEVKINDYGRKEFTYDSVGNLTRNDILEYDPFRDSTILLTKQLYYYDSTGKLIKKENYDKPEGLPTTVIYTYAGELLISEIMFHPIPLKIIENSNNIETYSKDSIRYEYNSDNKLVSEQTFHDNRFINIIFFTHFDINDRFEQTSLKQISASGNVISESYNIIDQFGRTTESYYKDEDEEWKCNYFFNEFGLLDKIETKYYPSNNSDITTFTYEYY